jgi:hypothetical protein
MAITAGTSVSFVNAPTVPDQLAAVSPRVQLQDGSFAGTVYTTEEAMTGVSTMIAFDANGNVLWTAQDDYPWMATADGGVAGRSGVIYDQHGAAVGQATSILQSWSGASYRAGSVEQIAANPVYYALSWFAFAGGNQSRNNAAQFRRDSIANDKVRNILTPRFWNKFSRSHCNEVLGHYPDGLPYYMPNYSVRSIQEKHQTKTNWYDVGNPGVADLTLKEVTAGYVQIDSTLLNWLNGAGANAAVAGMRHDRQSAVVMRPSVLTQERPQYTLVHELIFHAWRD